jgi:hypothetical protein
MMPPCVSSLDLAEIEKNERALFEKYDEGKKNQWLESVS